MELTSLVKLEDAKLKVESLALMPLSTRKQTTTSMAFKKDVTLYYLYAGTSDGCIAQYQLAVAQGVEPSQNDDKIEISAKQSQKRSLDITKSPVVAIEWDVNLTEPRIVVLCDGHVLMLHAETLDRCATFENLKVLEDVQLLCLGRGSLVSRMAVLVKRQLMCFKLTEMTCVPISSESQSLVVPEGVQAIAWCVDTLVVATKRDCTVYDAATNQVLESLVTEKHPGGPLLRFIGDGTRVVIRTTAGTLHVWDGKARESLDASNAIQFDEPPISFMHCDPFYVCASQTGKITIRSLYDGKDVPFPVAPLGTLPRCDTTFGPMGMLGVGRDVLALTCLPLTLVVKAYIEANALDRAVAHFTNGFKGEEDDFKRSLKIVYFQCGLEAFARRDDTVAFSFFSDSAADPRDVISLFPDLQNKEHLCPLTAHVNQRRAATLTQGRLTVKDSPPYQLLYEMLMKHRDSKRPDVKQQALDHAVFCMIIRGKVEVTNESCRLFFLPCNNLDFEVCESLLESEPETASKSRIQSLLLATHGKHKEALQLCRKNHFVSEAVVTLHQCEDSVLFSEHLPWMLIDDPKEAVKAVSTAGAMHTPAPELVMSIMAGCSEEVLKEYYCYLVTSQRVKDPVVHTEYALTLIRMVSALKPLSGTSESLLNLRAGKEAGLLGELRQELMGFLASSAHYDSDLVLAHLHCAQLSEELAVVHTRNRDHEQALLIYVYTLDDVALAEEYCIQQHAKLVEKLTGQSGAEGSTPQLRTGAKSARVLLKTMSNAATTFMERQPSSTPEGGGACGAGHQMRFNEIFTTLLRVLLNPPSKQPQQKLAEALSLLDRQSRMINPISVLDSLPGETCFGALAPYFKRIFQSLGHRRTTLEVTSQCFSALANNGAKMRQLLLRRSVLVDDERRCVVCNKRVGDSVFAVFPNLKVAHFRCIKDKDRDPQRGVPFRGTQFECW